MEMDIANTILSITLGAIIAILIYVWFLMSGTHQMYAKEVTKYAYVRGFATVIIGNLVFGAGVGLFLTMILAFAFGGTDVLTPFIIACGSATLIAVFYLSIKDPRHKNRS